MSPKKKPAKASQNTVWVASADGSGARPLTTGNHNTYVSPEWMPDGKYIVSGRGVGEFGLPKLWMYDVEGGTGMALTRAPGAAAAPAWPGR